eukprot:1473203-Pleurochrysis_carterae.AAC.1
MWRQELKEGRQARMRVRAWDAADLSVSSTTWTTGKVNLPNLTKHGAFEGRTPKRSGSNGATYSRKSAATAARQDNDR